MRMSTYLLVIVAAIFSLVSCQSTPKLVKDQSRYPSNSQSIVDNSDVIQQKLALSTSNKKAIKLSNGLDIYLVSDPYITQGSASMNVAVGITTLFLTVCFAIFYLASQNYYSDETKKYFLQKEQTLLHRFQAQLETLHQDVRFIATFEDMEKMYPLLLKTNHKSKTRKQLANKVNFHLIEEVMVALLNQRPAYYQARFIDIHGDEVIRVHKVDSETAKHVPVSLLQNKSDKDYFIEGLKDLDSSLPHSNSNATSILYSTVKISGINLNQENGLISIPHISTLRSTQGISIDGESVGILVINVDFDLMMQPFTITNEESDKLIFDNDGNYLYHREAKKKMAHILNSQKGLTFRDYPPIKENLAKISYSPQSILELEDKTIIISKLTIDTKSNYNVYFGSIFKSQYFFSHFNDFFREMTMMMLIAIILLIGILYYSLNYLLKPVSALIKCVDTYRNEGQYEPIIYTSKNEIGKLTSTFNTLIRDVAKKENELIELNKSLQQKVDNKTKELRNSEKTLKSILRHAPSAVYLKDGSGRYLYINKAFEYMFAVSPNNVLGYRDEEIFSQKIADSLSAKERLTRTTNTTQTFEDQINTTIGEFSIVFHIFPIDEESENELICAVLFDVTEREVAQKTIEEERARVLSNSQLATLGEMAGGIAHEVNNPLAIISGSAWQMRRVLQTESISTYDLLPLVDRIEKTTDRIAKIIKGLRSFSRNADNDPFEITEISEIIDNTLELCRSRLKHLQIKLNVSDLPNESVYCREAQIGQVLLNLINNAIDATRNLPEEDKWIALSIEVKDEQAYFRIMNGGPTIDTAIIPKIMQPFFTTKKIGEGTGLGLSISTGIVESHKGKLRLVENRFTTFEFSLSLIPNEKFKKTG